MGLNFFEKLTDKAIQNLQDPALKNQAQQMEQKNTKNVEMKLQNPLFKKAVDFYDRIVDTPNRVALDQLYCEAARRWANTQMMKMN